MRVVCDNCGASYKIPETKLTKEVNKATCRKCGHAIYIRKAPEVAESAPQQPNITEERTLITSSADLQQRARGGFSDMAPHRAVNPASQESTLPRADLAGPDPHGHAGPSLTIVPPDQASPPTLSPAPSLSYAPPPAGLSAAQDMPTQRAERPRPPPQADVATQRQRPERPAVADAPPIRAAAPPPAAERPPLRPSPMEDRGMPPVSAAPGYDPRADLSFAMLASMVTVFGVVILLANSMFASVLGSVWLTAAGAFFAILGCVATVLVLLTGGRGTRQASWIASIVGGFVFAGGGAAAAVAAGSMFSSMESAATPTAEAPKPEPSAVAAVEPVVAEPVPEPVVAEPAVADPVPEPVVAEPVPEPVAAPTPVKTEPAKSEPKKTTTTSTKSTSSSSTTKSTASTPERITPTATSTTSTTSTPTTTTTSTTKSTVSSTPTTTTTTATAAAATGVSTTVIDTMMRSNKSVKNCFITEKNESGTLPSGVKVKFTIQPSGKVSSATIPSGDYQGTAFDGCLSGAVKSISFPPFTGDPVTLTYPFRL